MPIELLADLLQLTQGSTKLSSHHYLAITSNRVTDWGHPNEHSL